MTTIVGGVVVGSDEIASLSDLTEDTTITMDTVRKIRNRILIRIANLTSGIDYTEHGDTGHTTSMSATLNSLRHTAAMLNDMLENDNVVDPSVIKMFFSEWNNPDL